MNLLLLKAISYLVLISGLALILPRVHVTFWYVVVSSAILIAIGWMGDRMLMPHLKPMVAAIADGVMAFVVLWIVGILSPYTYVDFLYLILAGILTAGFEWYFHQAVYKRKKEEYSS